jgi:LacI family transcriptional regulator
MVAQRAGVSPSTVSRILNGTAKVSPEKATAVAAAIRTLGFVPNPVARGLAGGRSFSIGVITQAIDSPFYGPSLRGIEDELDPQGYSSLIVSAKWSSDTEARCVDTLRARRVDGIIVLTGRLSHQALRACAKSVPVVVTGRTLKAKGLFAMGFDNYEGGRLATQHLLDLGHRSIVFISGDPAHPDSSERLRGYQFALEASRIAYDPALVTAGDYTEASGLLAITQLLDRRRDFTAIFAANDQMAAGAALGLHRANLKIPGDVSLVGFDDLSVSEFSVPPLTTIHQSTYEQGSLAARAMLQLIGGALPTLQIPPPRLVTRESTRRI